MDRLKVLNRNQIKYILIIAMVIDHIAWRFVPIGSVLGQVMHFVGRLTGPGMAILLAEGYQYTKNKKKYALRLFIFSIISWPAFTLFEYGKWPTAAFSVISALFLSFIAIWMWDESNLPKAVKIVLLVIICIIAMPCDWNAICVLWVFFFYIYRDDKKKQWISYFIISAIWVGAVIMVSWKQIFQLGVVLVPLLLLVFYNGESGKKSAFNKWFFYVFYPLHLFILFLIAWHFGCYK